MKILVILLLSLCFLNVCRSQEQIDFENFKMNFKKSLDEIKTISIKHIYSGKGKKRDGSDENITQTVQYDIKKEDNKFFQKISELDPPQKYGYSILSPEFSATVSSDKKLIYLFNPQPIPYKDYFGLFHQYDLDSYLDVSHNFENFEKDVQITQNKFDIVNCDYKGIPCVKLMYEYYYTGQLQGGTKFSKVYVNYIFDKRTFLLYEHYTRKVNYNDEEEIESPILEVVLSYEYLQVNEDFPPDYFDYKHLLDLGYKIEKK